MLTVGKIFLILIAIVGAGAGGVYFFSYFKTGGIEGEKLFNPALLDWLETSSTASWSPRDAHSLVVYQDKLWLLGGVEGKSRLCSGGYCQYWEFPHKSEVWTSEDGINWNLATDKAAWGKRRSIGAIVFQDKMWLMGGWDSQRGYLNDVWYSENGEDWFLATSTANWPTREGHTLTVFQNKMWLIGGVHFDKREVMNDVWYSEDGVNWLQVTSTIPWSPRYDHTVTVFQDKLWLIGGVGEDGEAKNDIWVSANGLDWELAQDHPFWPARHGHTSLVFQNRLWLISGWNTEKNKGLEDVWYSEDGYRWEKTWGRVPWLGREDHASAVFKDEIWLMGGMDTNWTWKNDIWHSVFYSNLEPTKNTILYPFKIPFSEKLLAQVSQFFKTSKNQKSLEVDIARQKLKIIKGEKVIREFSIVTGDIKTPTPTGNFRVYNKRFLVFSNLAQCWLPYWVGFTADGLYGFHMTPICRNTVSSSSLGCVRLGFEDAKFLYNWVKIGTPIKIYSETLK